MMISFRMWQFSPLAWKKVCATKRSCAELLTLLHVSSLSMVFTGSNRFPSLSVVFAGSEPSLSPLRSASLAINIEPSNAKVHHHNSFILKNMLWHFRVDILHENSSNVHCSHWSKTLQSPSSLAKKILELCWKLSVQLMISINWI